MNVRIEGREERRKAKEKRKEGEGRKEGRKGEGAIPEEQIGSFAAKPFAYIYNWGKMDT